MKIIIRVKYIFKLNLKTVNFKNIRFKCPLYTIHILHIILEAVTHPEKNPAKEVRIQTNQHLIFRKKFTG